MFVRPLRFVVFCQLDQLTDRTLRPKHGKRIIRKVRPFSLRRLGGSCYVTRVRLVIIWQKRFTFTCVCRLRDELKRLESQQNIGYRDEAISGCVDSKLSMSRDIPDYLLQFSDVVSELCGFASLTEPPLLVPTLCCLPVWKRSKAETRQKKSTGSGHKTQTQPCVWHSARDG